MAVGGGAKLAYQRRMTLTPTQIVDQALRRIAARGEDRVWIARVSEADLRRRALMLERLGADGRTLFGMTFAVKDNIDVAGMPTTAGCPDFAYTPPRSAEVVDRLEAAGAILIGKTNLDQFATGLVGTRSPYGVPANPYDPAYIPGRSSSGSVSEDGEGIGSLEVGLGHSTVSSQLK